MSVDMQRPNVRGGSIDCNSGSNSSVRRRHTRLQPAIRLLEDSSGVCFRPVGQKSVIQVLSRTLTTAGGFAVGVQHVAEYQQVCTDAIAHFQVPPDDFQVAPLPVMGTDYVSDDICHLGSNIFSLLKLHIANNCWRACSVQ
jgi:hypothetical protein